MSVKMEQWKPIIGYEDRYHISNYGEVKVLSTGHILSPGTIKAGGHQLVTLTDEYGMRKGFLVHRLVAIHFIPNPENLAIVEHLDDDVLHNVYTNLKWSTQKENARKGRCIPVVCLDANTLDFVAEYACAQDASLELAGNANGSNIGYAINGRQRTAYGYEWRYSHDYYPHVGR